jgi:hypothetical protein
MIRIAKALRRLLDYFRCIIEIHVLGLQKEAAKIYYEMALYPVGSYGFERRRLGAAIIECKIEYWLALICRNWQCEITELSEVFL